MNKLWNSQLASVSLAKGSVRWEKMASGDRDGSSRPATGHGGESQRWEGIMVLHRAFSLLSPQISL